MKSLVRSLIPLLAIASSACAPELINNKINVVGEASPIKSAEAYGLAVMSTAETTLTLFDSEFLQVTNLFGVADHKISETRLAFRTQESELVVFDASGAEIFRRANVSHYAVSNSLIALRSENLFEIIFEDNVIYSLSLSDQDNLGEFQVGNRIVGFTLNDRFQILRLADEKLVVDIEANSISSFEIKGNVVAYLAGQTLQVFNITNGQVTQNGMSGVSLYSVSNDRVAYYADQTVTVLDSANEFAVLHQMESADVAELKVSNYLLGVVKNSVLELYDSSSFEPIAVQSEVSNVKINGKVASFDRAGNYGMTNERGISLKISILRQTE